MACWTQQEIADEVEVDRTTVTRWTEDYVNFAKSSKTHKTLATFAETDADGNPELRSYLRGLQYIAEKKAPHRPTKEGDNCCPLKTAERLAQQHRVHARFQTQLQQL